MQRIDKGLWPEQSAGQFYGGFFRRAHHGPAGAERQRQDDADEAGGGLLVPTGGSLRVCGQAPGPQTKARVAYLPERTYLPAGLRVREALELFCDFYADFSREKAVSMLADLKIQPGTRSAP